MYVFHFWSSLAIKLSRKCIIYYGASGHGKGLIDAMSAFGVKNPIRRAVLTENFAYNKAIDIYNYLIKYFELDDQKKHFLIKQDAISAKQESKASLNIKGCRNIHMICFYPDGTIQTKFHICSCESCLDGEFINCIEGKGSFLPSRQNEVESDSETESDVSDDENVDEAFDELETFEIKSNNIIEIIQPGSVIALYSPPEAFELFYLCKVVKVGVATEPIADKFNHFIESGSKYVKCQYFEKIKEKRSKICYKILPDITYVLPYQVMNPMVNLNDHQYETFDRRISMACNGQFVKILFFIFT